MQMGVAPAMLVIEPTGRNTAPVLALRAMCLARSLWLQHRRIDLLHGYCHVK